MDYPDILVQRVNELYHDLIGEKYDHSHPEIFKRLPTRWRRLGKQFLLTQKPLKILDLGTGTGFVPLTIGDLLKKTDTFFCSDISNKILKVAEEHLKKKNFLCKFKFIKIDAQSPLQLPLKQNSFDIITINSTLHHIKDADAFLKEVDRVLNPKGLVFIAHEPNERFNSNLFLKLHSSFLKIFLCPKHTLTKVFRKIGLENILEYLYYTFASPKINNKKICTEINKILFKEGLIKKMILPKEIKRITDINAKNGFKPQLIFPNYKLLKIETYNHLSDEIAKKYNNKFILTYERFLEKNFPGEGNTFFLIKQKIH
ncbi:MAG: class I SAM-dependent methyltransferase [Nanoarchaeota archaeon]